MPETRRAAKRRKVEEGPLLSVDGASSLHLPPSVVNVVFEFCDFATLLNVASCNTKLKRFVYEESETNYWRVLDFATVKKEWSNQITDEQLDALLRRINAREKCLAIRLTGCLNIQGRGLESLRGGASTLKEIDLRLVHPDHRLEYEHTEVDLDEVLPILSSMAPFPPEEGETDNQMNNSLGMALVKFHAANPTNTNYFERHEERIADWLEDFYGHSRERAIELRTPCDYCGAVIADQQTYEDFWAVMPSQFCDHCFRYSCGEGRCPRVSGCQKCQRQYCQPGGRDFCTCTGHKDDKGYINACENETCGKFYCCECDEYSAMCENEGCAKFFCFECADDHGLHCASEACLGYFCSQCHASCLEKSPFPVLYCLDCIGSQKEICSSKADNA